MSVLSLKIPKSFSPLKRNKSATLRLSIEKNDVPLPPFINNIKSNFIKLNNLININGKFKEHPTFG